MLDSAMSSLYNLASFPGQFPIHVHYSRRPLIEGSQKDGYYSYRPPYNAGARLSDFAAPNDGIFADIVATQPPKDVMEPHGSNPFALNDGAADQPEKRLSVYDQKILEARRPSITDHQEYPPPTDEERGTLRKVADSIPNVAYWLCAVEFAERASYYGVQTVFSNFLEFPLPQGKKQSRSLVATLLELIIRGRR